MEENKNEIEVTTTVTENDGYDVSTEINVEESSGPSKGFWMLVGGGLTAAAMAAIAGIKHHNKKKKAKAEIEESENEDLDDYVEGDFDGDYEEDDVQKEEKPVKK